MMPRRWHRIGHQGRFIMDGHNEVGRIFSVGWSAAEVERHAALIVAAPRLAIALEEAAAIASADGMPPALWTPWRELAGVALSRRHQS